jgi:hypothetical protein
VIGNRFSVLHSTLFGPQHGSDFLKKRRATWSNDGTTTFYGRGSLRGDMVCKMAHTNSDSLPLVAPSSAINSQFK